MRRTLAAPGDELAAVLDELARHLEELLCLVHCEGCVCVCRVWFVKISCGGDPGVKLRELVDM